VLLNSAAALIAGGKTARLEKALPWPPPQIDSGKASQN